MAKCHKCGKKTPGANLHWIALERDRQPDQLPLLLSRARICGTCESLLAEMLADACGGKEKDDGTVQG